MLNGAQLHSCRMRNGEVPQHGGGAAEIRGRESSAITHLLSSFSFEYAEKDGELIIHSACEQTTLKLLLMLGATV